MAGLCVTLQQRLGVPVIDSVAAAVQLCEALVGLGLRTSKQGDDAQRLLKLYRGWAVAGPWLGRPWAVAVLWLGRPMGW